MKTKKCITCHEEKTVDYFGRASNRPDGKNNSCIACCRMKTFQRRRSLDFVLKGCPMFMKEKMIEMFNEWQDAGFPEFKRPVVVGERVMTMAEKKNSGYLRKGKEIQKIKKGIVVETFNSIRHAMRQTSMSFGELKFLCETGTEKNGFIYRVKTN